MARSKPKHVIPIGDIEDANQALLDMAEVKRRLAVIEAALNETLDQAKAQAGAEAAPWKERLTALETGLEAFALHQKDELFSDRKRSIDGPFGRFGFRLSTSLKLLHGWTWGKVLGALKAIGQTAYIHTKEEVNKEALSLEMDELLVTVGVRRETKDEIWYEVAEVEIDPPASSLQPPASGLP